MALAFRSFSHDGAGQSSFMRNYERSAELKKLGTLYLPATTPEEQPAVPRPEFFDSLDNLNGDLDALPTISECAVHLQLLEEFVALKQKVLTSNSLDRAFAIVPKGTLVSRAGKKQLGADYTFKERQAVKWPIFVRIAAARFLRWWTRSSPALQVQGNRLSMAENLMPPIDVLMVWHAFLHSPVQYETFCEDTGREDMLKLQFPWQSIHRLLVDDNPSLKLGTQAKDFDLSVGEVGLFESLACHNDHSESFRTALQSLVPTKGTSRLSVAFPGLRGTPFSDNGWKAVDNLGILVERQAAFAEKMANLLWLRSPTVEGTLERALVRYERFMALFKKHPKVIFVPTLDIDAVWHTQLCTPICYRAACSKLAGRTINHNNALEAEVLKNGFAETSRLYELQFQEEYNSCLCWHCEGMKSELENVGPTDDIDIAAITQKVKDDVTYYKAVELAKRKGNPLPSRTLAPAAEA